MKIPAPQDIIQAQLRLQAAELLVTAKRSEWHAMLMAGTRREIERARIAVLSATEACLDAEAFNTRLNLMARGIDVDLRL